MVISMINKPHKYNEFQFTILIILVTSLISCSSAPSVYLSNATISSQLAPTQRQVGVAILSASRFYEPWTITKIRPGEMRGILSYGQHTATVLITYDTNYYHIVHQRSHNFDYDEEDQTIHPRYNSWVKKLENRIHEEIQYHMQLFEEQEQLKI
jgi:hypothetical protein